MSSADVGGVGLRIRAEHDLQLIDRCPLLARPRWQLLGAHARVEHHSTHGSMIVEDGPHALHDRHLDSVADGLT